MTEADHENDKNRCQEDSGYRAPRSSTNWSAGGQIFILDFVAYLKLLCQR